MLFVLSLVIFFSRDRVDPDEDIKESSEQARHHNESLKPAVEEAPSLISGSEKIVDSVPSRELKEDIVTRPTIAQIQVFEQKLSAIKSLGYILSPDEIDAVFDLLNTPYRPEFGVTSMQWDSLKNEAFNQLIKQEAVPEAIYARLSSIWSNQQLSEPSREYAVQFYVLFLDRSIREDAYTEDDLSLISSALANSKLQGTAMLGLGHLADEFPVLLESVELSEIAREAVSNHSSARVRSAAIQTLIRLGDTSELSRITDIAVHSRDTVERLSAIAALGALGGSDEIHTIAQIQISETPLFANAAQVARDKIYSRLETNQAF